MFQSTFPRGERLIRDTSADALLMFQSTFPRGERPGKRATGGYKQQGFNPRSHAGNDTIIVLPRLICVVSIHVPARGTTDDYHKGSLRTSVSIHVPARGTTWSEWKICIIKSRFNPRSREGNDHCVNDICCFLWRFNPRSREGND